MKYSITEMTLDRYNELLAFWHNIEGIWNSDDDNYDNLCRFLQRNPGLSLMVIHQDSIIGTIKCSHDGRRGYLHHLAVKKEFRNQGIGRKLVERCIQNLNEEGIKKIRVFVIDGNDAAIGFWKNLGFSELIEDYKTFQYEY